MINPSPVVAEKGAPLFPRHALVPVFLVTALFFFWGIPNNLNDVLIKQFEKSFAISRLAAGFVQFAFYLGYFVLSMPAALLMRKYGYKAGLITGLVLYGCGAFLFYPAALAQSYIFFLCALFVIASGLAFLETGASPFIAQLGDSDSSERRLNFAQAFNPLGSITGAWVGITFIFSGVELSANQIASMKAAGTYAGYLHQETTRVTTPYAILGCVVLLWAFLMSRVKFPELGEERDHTAGADHGRFFDLFRHRHYLAAVAAQFFYVGAQVGTWSYFIQYVQQYTHEPEKRAGDFLIGTLVAFAVGRFAATYLMKTIPADKLMGIYAVINVALTFAGFLFPGWMGMWAILITSFFMSLMFPTIFALGLKGLGPNVKLGGSLLVMAIIGGAILTPVMGLVFQKTASMAAAMLVPLACYVFVAWFAFSGSRVRTA